MTERTESICTHGWIQTPWNPTFTDGDGRFRLYDCLECGFDLSLEEMDKSLSSKQKNGEDNE